jgi:lysophospholipase L1-like esterase
MHEFPRMHATALLVFTLIVGIAAPAFAQDTEVKPPPSDPVTPVPRDRDFAWMPLAEWNRQHAAFCAAAAKGEAELVFHGDSIIASAQWSESWKKAFAQYRWVDFGLGGDRTQNLLWRLENGEIGALKPKVVVVLIGTNNLFTTKRDVEDTVRGITAVAQKLHTAYPSAKILVLGVFPRGEAPDAPERIPIVKINKALAKLDDGQSIFVQDVGNVFLEPNGTLPRAISPDQLHLSEEGLRRWAEAIAPTVQKLMQ